MRSVGSVDSLMGTNDNRSYNVALLYNTAGGCSLNGSNDYVANVSGLSERTAQYANTHQFFCATIVSGS
jgi:hypothetical protein